MPIYVYECAEGHRKEEIRKISERENAPQCDCGHSMRMVITPVNINGAFLGSAKNPGYKCPITEQWVSSKKQRRNIMAQHNVIECG
jgi:putative FmdB family regulatory protein